MAHYVLTYNIDNATNRTDFVNDFENILQSFKLNKESSNQSTYFGFNANIPMVFVKILFNAVNKLDWQTNDIVTIYYPKVTNARPNNIPDIGVHLLKQEGNNFLNNNLIQI